MKKIIGIVLASFLLLTTATTAFAGMPGIVHGTIHCHQNSANPQNCPTPGHN